MFLKVNGTGGAVEWENFRDHFAATSKMAYFGPSGANTAFSASPFWHDVFCGFSGNRPICNNPFFAKSRRATQNTKMRMGAAEEIYFGHFLKTPILSFVWPFQDLKRENPIFTTVLDIFALRYKMQASHPKKARRRCRRWKTTKMKDKQFVFESLIFSMVPQDDDGYFTNLLR